MKHKLLFSAKLAFAFLGLISLAATPISSHSQGQGEPIHVGVHEMCGTKDARASNNAYEFRVDGNRIPNDLGQYSKPYFLSYGSHNFSLLRDGQPVVIRRAIVGAGFGRAYEKVFAGGSTSINVPFSKDLPAYVLLEVETCGSSSTPKPPTSTTSTPPARPRLATVGGLHGDVSVSRNDGTFVDLTPGSELQPGDEISTGPDSEATVTFPDGSTVLVQPMTQISLASLETQRNSVKVRMNIRFGKVAAKVNKEKTASSDYSVETPTATASVRGTSFTVEYDKQTQATTVEVEEGTVQVTPNNPSLRPLTLSAGQQVQVAQNRVGEVMGNAESSSDTSSSGTSHPHTVRNADGTYRPANGYTWVNPDDPKDARVKPKPGLIENPDGSLHPSGGYTWVNRDDPNDLRVQPKPGLVEVSPGEVRPAPGYRWVNPNDPNDFRVERIP